MKGWKKSGDVINRQRVDIGYEIWELREEKKNVELMILDLDLIFNAQ